MAKEILIADPDKADQEEFKNIFELAGYRLVYSENGEETLLRVKLFKPDLIIAGTGLGKMSGFELCEAIKTDPELKHIPVILLSNIFEEISKRERDRVRADGFISKPFHEDEVLNLVDHLLEEETMKAKKEFSLEGLEETEEEEEEIIELVDVIEEPEEKMSIHDFVAPDKEEPFREITPLESWERLELGEKPLEKEFTRGREEKEEEMEGMLLQLEEEITSKEASGEVTPEDELFGKIELEEILEKVEKLKPSLEKEWPEEKEEGKREEVSVFEKEPQISEEQPEKYVGLEEFEAALQKEVESEAIGEAIQPLRPEEPKAEAPVEIPATEVSLEEELKGLLEEEFPEELFEELGEEEIKVVEEPKEEGLEIFEELEAPMTLEEEVVEKPEEIRAEEIRPEETRPEEIRIDELEELGFPRAVLEEVREQEIRVIEEPKEKKIEILERVDTPRPLKEEISLPLRRVEEQMGEVIAKGVQEMMENFVTNIIPEMAQNIITLTVDRIERMVREVVPDLAEKAIQEEIKRLEKGEKD
jgi:CheY-like chemotaxis protein